MWIQDGLKPAISHPNTRRIVKPPQKLAVKYIFITYCYYIHMCVPRSPFDYTLQSETSNDTWNLICNEFMYMSSNLLLSLHVYYFLHCCEWNLISHVATGKQITTFNNVNLGPKFLFKSDYYVKPFANRNWLRYQSRNYRILVEGQANHWDLI